MAEDVDMTSDTRYDQFKFLTKKEHFTKDPMIKHEIFVGRNNRQFIRRKIRVREGQYSGDIDTTRFVAEKANELKRLSWERTYNTLPKSK